MAERVPARLHVLFARQSHTAVVIRRGPTRHVCAIHWNRRTDQFRVGQWLYGRIYERRCDLSPDGKHLIYFAMNGWWDSRVQGAWTAVSRAPYLQALSLFAKGDCWHGGGLFLSERTYWLNDGYGHTVLEDHAPLSRTETYPGKDRYGGECPGVYYVRLQRDGWALTGIDRGKDDEVATFDKRINNHWTLRKRAHATVEHPVGKGCYFDTHELIDLRTGAMHRMPEWEWAEVDGSRVVWAEGGKLMAARVGSLGPKSSATLRDFNEMTFERIKAPY